MTLLNEKTIVLITGAAGGIGRLLAEQGAARGAHVILWDVNRQALDSLERELIARGHSASAYMADLTDRAGIRTAAKRVLQDHGRVDVLINNAGIVSGKLLLDATEASIQHTFDVNALAPIWTTRAFLPGMLERGRGHIVTVASAGGLVGTAKLTDYCASKFAAVGFDESLRLELRRLGYPEIRTTVVCPYYVNTGMFAGVKTRFPRLLPVMRPETVVARIVRAIERNHSRLIMPRFVYTAFLARLLPVPVFDWLMDFFGINTSMDEFQGRGDRPR